MTVVLTDKKGIRRVEYDMDSLSSAGIKAIMALEPTIDFATEIEENNVTGVTTVTTTIHFDKSKAILDKISAGKCDEVDDEIIRTYGVQRVERGDISIMKDLTDLVGQLYIIMCSGTGLPTARVEEMEHKIDMCRRRLGMPLYEWGPTCDKREE